MIRFRFLVQLFALGMIAAGASAQQRGDFMITYREPGSNAQRTVQMWAPEEGSLDAERPLLLAWHGAGMPAGDMRAMLRPIARQLGAILVVPEYTGVHSDEFLDIMADSSMGYAMANYRIDSARVINTGFSWGGGIAFKMGLRRPELFDGIITLSPAIDTNAFTSTMWNNLSRTRLGTILGDQDFYYQQVKAAMLEIERRGGELLFIEKPGVTHSDPVYFASTEFHDDYLHIVQFVTASASSVARAAFEGATLRITPNPASSHLRIESVHATRRITSVAIYDARGERVASGIASDPQAVLFIDVSGLAEGYYLALVEAGGYSLPHRFIIMR